jgi:hypothetical protein
MSELPIGRAINWPFTCPLFVAVSQQNEVDFHGEKPNDNAINVRGDFHISSSAEMIEHVPRVLARTKFCLTG